MTRTPMLAFKLSPGEEGISESLSGMAEVVRQVRILGTPGTGRRVLDKSNTIAAGVGGRATFCEGYLLAVYDFLLRHVEFTEDPPFIELVRHPDELLDTIARAGKCRCDCDEVATLGAALLWARSIEPVFMVVGKPGDFDAHGRVRLKHVFYAARIEGRLLPFDPQERIPPGQWPPRGAIGRLEAYSVLQQNRAGG